MAGFRSASTSENRDLRRTKLLMITSTSIAGKFGDYFVINVARNTPGLRDLQETFRLQQIIRVTIGRRPESRCWSRSHRISPTSELLKSPSYARAKESPVCSQPMRRSITRPSQRKRRRRRAEW